MPPITLPSGNLLYLDADEWHAAVTADYAHFPDDYDWLSHCSFGAAGPRRPLKGSQSPTQQAPAILRRILQGARQSERTAL